MASEETDPGEEAELAATTDISFQLDGKTSSEIRSTLHATEVEIADALAKHLEIGQEAVNTAYDFYNGNYEVFTGSNLFKCVLQQVVEKTLTEYKESCGFLEISANDLNNSTPRTLSVRFGERTAGYEKAIKLYYTLKRQLNRKKKAFLPMLANYWVRTLYPSTFIYINK